MRDWSNRDVLHHIRFRDVNAHPAKFITEKLGAPTTLQEGEWSTWHNEDYMLYVSAEGDVDLDVTVLGLEEALKALRWDLGMGDFDLPRAEHKALFARGREEGEKFKFEIPSKEVPDLRQFVLDYCDGKLLCDHQVRDPNLLGMVFMPLLFGAFSIEPKEGEAPSPAYLARKSLLKDPGPEPVLGNPPPAPTKPPYPPEPPPSEPFQEPDPEKVQIIKDDIEWGVAPPERLTNYLEEIRLHNVGVEFHHREALDEWERQKQAIDLEHEQALQAHQRTLRSWHRRGRRMAAKQRQWKLDKARQDALAQGFQMGLCGEIAVIYEYMDKALPRSINGYPCFTSFHVLNRADWERARKAIYRELQHRENMEI